MTPSAKLSTAFLYTRSSTPMTDASSSSTPSPLTISHLGGRALGALLGQCVGDALGCRYTFRSADDVQVQIAADRDEETNFLPLRGSAVFEFPPGQVSDGTEYCMLIARSLSRQSGIDISDIVNAILRWKRSDPIGTHNPVFEALELEPENEDPQVSGRLLEKKITLSALLKNRSSLSNMCLSVASPLAIATATRTNTGAIASRLTRLTQPHPAAQDAVRVLAAAIRALILCPDPQTAFDTAVSAARTDVVRDHLNDAQHQAHPQPDTETSSSSTNELPFDYLGTILQIAFYELLYANSFANGVVDAISYGGDTTNNAAITGALLGARFGVDSIPDQWRTTVEHARLDRQKVFPDVCLADADALVKRLLYKLSF